MTDVSTLSVLAVGDVFPDVTNGRAAFRLLEPLFATADVVFGNCEGVYSDRPAKSPTHKHYMGTSRERGAFLGEVGFDVMTLANNHMFDGGRVGLEDTRALLREQGIATTGAGATLAEALTPAIAEHRGVRVAFLGVCSVFPKGYEARKNRPGIAPLRVDTAYLDPDENFWEPGIEPRIVTIPNEADLAAVADAIAAARAAADYVVVAPHWGYSSTLEQLKDYEPALARRLVDAGADVVLAAHHHALRPVEWHRCKPIFYGLGALVHHFQGPALTPEMRADRDRRYGPFSSFTQPEVEYELWPFAEQSRHTMIAALDLAPGGGRMDVGFYPAEMEQDGSTTPLRPGDPRAKVVCDYVARMSADRGLDTVFEAGERGGYAFVRVTSPEGR